MGQWAALAAIYFWWAIWYSSLTTWTIELCHDEEECVLSTKLINIIQTSFQAVRHMAPHHRWRNSSGRSISVKSPIPAHKKINGGPQMPAGHQMSGFNLIWAHFEWTDYLIWRNGGAWKKCPLIFENPANIWVFKKSSSGKKSHTPKYLNRQLSWFLTPLRS